jgi:hypothetical protein
MKIELNYNPSEAPNGLPWRLTINKEVFSASSVILKKVSGAGKYELKMNPECNVMQPRAWIDIDGEVTWEGSAAIIS